MRMVLILTAVLITGIPIAQAAQDYYKWTDENGVTHYSARKPHNQAAEVISIKTGQRVAIPAANQTNTASGTSRGAASQPPAGSDESLKDRERCQTAQDNLETMRTNARVRMREENGEIRYLSEEEKAQKVQEFEKAMAESC
jgi:hypothetical protein